MKIATETRTDETTFEVKDSAEFSIKMGEKAFDILLDGLYSNKIRAVVREICTNAADAHAQAGCADIPFDVHLPTVLDPTFRVRDYGVAMTHDEVMTLYSTLFDSSKDQTNDAVGMLGLGSKSPFAYTDSFTLIVRLDGRRRIYSVRRGAEGIPRIDLLDDSEVDEAQGVEVSVPVEAVDFHSFAHEARIVFLGFAPVPNYDANFTLPDPIFFDDENNFAVFRGTDLPGQSRVFIRQGCVIYPVDDLDLIEKLTDIMSYGYGIVIDVPIGTANIAANREAIAVDDITRKNLAAIFEHVHGVVGKDVYERCDKECSTMLEAQIFWFENQGASTANLRQVFQIEPKWKGQTVYTQIDLGDILPRDKDGAKVYVKAKIGASRTEDEVKQIHFQSRKRYKFVYTTDEKVKRITLRYRDFLKPMYRGDQGYVIYLREPGKDLLAKIKKALGATDDQFIDIADLPDPGAPVKGGKEGIVAGAYVVTSAGRYKKLAAAEAPKKGGCWFVQVDRTTTSTAYNVWDKWETAHTLLGLDERPVITVTESAKKRLDLDDADSLVSGTTIAADAKKATVMEAIYQEAYNHAVRWSLKVPGGLRKLVKQYDNVPSTHALRRFYANSEIVAAEKKAEAEVASLKEKYPLLFGEFDTDAIQWYIDTRDKELTNQKGTLNP